MRNKIYIALGLVIVLMVAAMFYMRANTKKHSPSETATGKYDNLDVSVSYCRPFKKGRLIFGTKEAGALQPFGEYWRVGANEATEIKFSRDVNFGGKEVKAGQYRMYAIPGEKTWTVALNSELGEWGYFEADPEKDVARIQAAASKLDQVIDQFVIEFVTTDSGLNMQWKWDQTFVEIPIK